jgi:hypothetical protein
MICRIYCDVIGCTISPGSYGSLPLGESDLVVTLDYAGADALKKTGDAFAPSPAGVAFQGNARE